MSTAQPPKPRGRPPGRGLTTGNCGTREQLVECVKWYAANTSLSDDAIARRYAISAATVRKILRSV